MPIDLKVVLGTVNYTDYIRVSASKVSSPGVDDYVNYIDVPVVNYVFVIPGLDPTDYYLRFRDAPDVFTLGTLVMEVLVNAVTGEWIYERRFYRLNALPVGISFTSTTLTDPYLQNKNVSGVFKEGFRYLNFDGETSFDDATGIVSLTDGVMNFNGDETFIVEIKYNAGNNNIVSTAKLFADTITVDASSYSMSSLDKNKRFMLDCSTSKQVFTVCPVSSLSQGDVVIIENKRDGLQKQSKIIFDGTDKVHFNGFDLGAPNELSELWLAKGQSLFLRKEGTDLEILFEYQGTRVGERMNGTFKGHPNWLPEDGRLLDGDELPGLYWWIRNVLSNDQYVTDDTVSNPGYTFQPLRIGQFVIHSTGKAFRMPNTQNLYERGLKNFTTYGGDENRDYDSPGGWQPDQLLSHGHGIESTDSDRSGNDTATVVRGSIAGTVNTKGGVATGLPGGAGDNKTIRLTGGSENRVVNNGIIFLRHI